MTLLYSYSFDMEWYTWLHIVYGHMIRMVDVEYYNIEIPYLAHIF